MKSGLQEALALGVLALLCAATQAAPAPIDEVVVQGTRAELAEMRQQIVVLEDRFYDLYNELNQVPDFDVHCANEPRAGTRLKRRYCQAVFEEKAFAEEGQLAFQIRQHVQDQLSRGSRDPIMPSTPPVQAIVAIEARRPAFRKNLQELARRNPQLVRILAERKELERRYEATQRKVTCDRRPCDDE